MSICIDSRVDRKIIKLDVIKQNIEQIDAPSCTFEEKWKERDLVQSVINRMANSQLQTKIFCISVIAFIILIAFFFAKSNELTTLLCLFQFIIVTSILIVVIESFRALDLNFLRTEKIYRAWYDYIHEIRDTNRENLYLLNPIKMQEILVMHNRIDITTLNESTEQSWVVFRKIYWNTFLLVFVNYPDF